MSKKEKTKLKEKLQTPHAVENECMKGSVIQKDDAESEANQTKKVHKVVHLKQWLVSGYDKDGNRLSVLLLATCGLKAREAMASRYEGCQILNVMQSAESEKTADWLKTHSPFYD